MENNVEDLLRFAQEELKQLAEEGCDTWELERQASLIAEGKGPDQLKKARALCDALTNLKPSSDFPYEEPSELDAIRAHRPDGPRHIAVRLSARKLDERTLGTWLGRASGCMLGKPVEGWRRDKIDDLLEVCGVAELTDYFPPVPKNNRGVEFPQWASGLLRGGITRAWRDDDTDYTIIGLCILERHGRQFTPRHVADFWLNHVPYCCTYTAERVAYRNFVNDIWPPESARYRNPYREWIGAQIRADGFGYACPGKPEEAAGLAFKDACVSHVKNGIYGEMWVAAMLAAAFAADEPEKAIRIGLSEIPKNCRLAEAIGKVLDWHAQGVCAAEATDKVLAEFGKYHGVHTINNAAIVALGLLWGEKDFSRSIGLAVRAGLDTDCNGATTGSVLGAILGPSGIPEHWTKPLNDRIDTIVAGQSDLTLSGLAARTRKVQDAR
jgi:ADP-ribosylglycohydrolase